jgi:hypothetical protein
VFCVHVRTISDLALCNIDWFLIEKKSVYCAVRTEPLNGTDYPSVLKGFRKYVLRSAIIRIYYVKYKNNYDRDWSKINFSFLNTLFRIHPCVPNKFEIWKTIIKCRSADIKKH